MAPQFSPIANWQLKIENFKFQGLTIRSYMGVMVEREASQEWFRHCWTRVPEKSAMRVGLARRFGGTEIDFSS